MAGLIICSRVTPGGPRDSKKGGPETALNEGP